MDKKKIYIAIIVVCVLGSAGVLYWSYSGTGAVPAQDALQVSSQIEQSAGASSGSSSSSGPKNFPSVDKASVYPTPRVFPQETKLDMKVFESSQYAQLKDYTPLTVTPAEIGRDNPFTDY